MTVRETSAAAYLFVLECGWIGEKQKEIYTMLYHIGPATSAEVFREIFKNQRGRVALTQTRARFTELRDMGAIQEMGKRICQVTGHTVILWEVTAKIPVKPAPRYKPKTPRMECIHCNGTGYQDSGT